MSRFAPTEDTALATKFEELVGEGLRKCKEIGLTFLQAEVNMRGVTRSRDTAKDTDKEGDLHVANVQW